MIGPFTFPVISAILIPVLLIVLTLSSYVDRLYSEMGRFLSREFQENIDSWEKLIEPRLGLDRERVTLSAAMLSELSLAGLALLFGGLVFYGSTPHHRPTLAEIAQVCLGIVLIILLFNRLLPYVFFTRTRGIWMRSLILPFRLLCYLVLPVTVALGFFLSIASLGESKRVVESEGSAGAVEALIEAGQEEGILEESDRELVRSVVEFGDKIVRDVMTARPQIFAVPATQTIAAFLEELMEHPFSRVPVYGTSLDQVTGIIFAHDLLQVSDVEAPRLSVGSLQRPAVFVPEAKKVNELLREMQREKQHMRIVIDEYGGVAGVVTIEDLLEEIVGAIADEHEEHEAFVREPNGSYLLDGGFEVDRLPELFNMDTEPAAEEEEYDATTVGGLVSEAAGKIPLPGEVVEVSGLRLEVVSATDRRVERVRVSPIDSAPVGV